MNKKTYQRASLEVVAFDAEDIITTSPQDVWDNGVIVLPEDDIGIF